MPRTKAEILRDLDPSNPATIQALIGFHRTAFGGWKMEDDPAIGTDPAQQAGTDPQTGQNDPDKGDPADKPLGPNGESALKAEREARKALEAQFNQLKTGLAGVLGVTDKDAKSSTDDIVANLQQQMAALNHSNLVLSVANEHKITDSDDLALLGSIKDEDALRKLATRLKPSENQSEDKGGKRIPPKPDGSQGRGGSNDRTPGDAGRAEAARRFAKASTQK